MVFTTLNTVWAFAICREIFPAGEIFKTKAKNWLNKAMAMILPIKLKSTWERATRFALMLACRVAKTAVIHVPMLSPSKTGTAPSSGIRP